MILLLESAIFSCRIGSPLKIGMRTTAPASFSSASGRLLLGNEALDDVALGPLAPADRIGAEPRADRKALLGDEHVDARSGRLTTGWLATEILLPRASCSAR